MYEYRATVIRVVDGDTVYLDVDLGFRTHMEQDFRLAHINAPELSTAEGVNAKAALTELLGAGVRPSEHDSRFLAVGVPVVTARTFKSPDKYGRWLAELTLADGTNVNQWMVDNGYAKPYPEAK